MYTKAGLDKEGARLINQRIGEFGPRFLSILEELSVPNTYAYSKEYDGPKPIDVQIKALAQNLNLDPTQALEYAKNLPDMKSFVPEDARKWTGWFAIPSETDPRKNLHAIKHTYEKIAASRNFNPCVELTSDCYRMNARTAQALKHISKYQPGDILIIAAQLGMQHRGLSDSWARKAYAENEFGLDPLAVGSIVLNHPNRLVRSEELGMICSGADFDDSNDGDARFDHAPVIYFDNDRVEFAVADCTDAFSYFGSVSAFAPNL